MRLPTNQRVPRTGFTLIELLVVIAIIAILVSLTAAAVMKVRAKGPELVNRDNIQQIAAAVGTYQQRYSVDYLPSRIKLCRYLEMYDLSLNASGQPNNQLDMDSVQYIRRVFPKCAGQNPGWKAPTNAAGVPDPSAPVNGYGIVWCQDTNPNSNWMGPDYLEGHQCLIFFLGGRQNSSPAKCDGFYENPRNPMIAGTSGTSVGPFFEFKSSRLRAYASAAPGKGNPYFGYLDAYEAQPYAYFSSYKRTAGYNRYGAPGVGVSDCASLNPNLWPDLEGAGRFYNPGTFQLISAGADKLFGDGNSVLPLGGAGRDDISNFSSIVLGAVP